MSDGGVILALLAAVLAVAVLGVWEYGRGLDARRELVVRGSRGFQRHRASPGLDRWDARLRRTGPGRRLNRRLAAAGVRVRLTVFAGAMAGTGLAIVLLLGRLLSPFLGMLVAAGAGALLFGYLSRQEARRREEFIAQLPELARVLSNATSAGLAVRTALEMAAEELDEPARTELGRTAEALRLGQQFDDAMNDLRERLPSRELAVLVSTLVVSSRAGGSLITALRNISATLEQRKETRREVKTILGQSLVAGYAVFGMGVSTVLVMAVVNPGVLERMSGSLLGQLILALAAALFAAALFLVRRMSRIDV